MTTQGEHPKHRGVSEAAMLGTVERYFVEIMAIPRLQQRIHCFILSRSFDPAMQRVRMCSEQCTHQRMQQALLVCSTVLFP